jgi:hypothetical protein
VSIVEAGHDEAVLQIVGDQTVYLGFGFDFIVVSYEGEDAGWGDNEGLSPGTL